MSEPEEVYTVVYCRACEMVSLAGDVTRQNHTADKTGDQLGCPRCDSRLNAESFYDFVDIQATNYGK